MESQTGVGGKGLKAAPVPILATGSSRLLQAPSLEHFQGWGIPTFEHPSVGKERGQAGRNWEIIPREELLSMPFPVQLPGLAVLLLLLCLLPPRRMH